MASYRIVIKASAAKELEAVPFVKDRQRIVERIEGLHLEPRPPGCRKLSGAAKYRVRQGHFRIVYAVQDSTRTVTVVRTANRRKVYRA